MTRRTTTISLALTLAALSLAAGPRRAAAGDDEGFPFHLDPLQVDTMFTDVDSNSSKYEEYQDRSEGVLVPRLHLLGQSRDGRHVFDLLAKDITRDDQRWTASYDRSGSWKLEVDFNKIVHRFGNDGTLLHGYTAPGVYSLSDSIQSALQTAIANKYAATTPPVINYGFLSGQLKPYIDAAPGVDPQLKRDRTRAHLDIGKMGAFAWGLDFNHENRTGNRPYGAAFGFSNVIELPEPIDYDTIGAGLTGEWNGKGAGLRVGYNFSSFANHIDSMLYDNPFRKTDATDAGAYSAPGAGSIAGPAVGRNALAPDNTAQTLTANGRTKLGDAGWLDGSLSYAMLTQDDELLPFSTNTAINVKSGAPFDVTDPGNLPESHADGDVRTLQASARAGFDLGDKVALTARWRYYNYDNQSSRFESPGYVRFDAAWEPIGRITVPYEYHNSNLGADLGWNFARASHLHFGYERRNMTRSLREIEDSTEDAFKASLNTQAGDDLMLRASVEHGNRSISDYDVEAAGASFTEPEGANNLPLLRKFDEAARTFNSGRALALFSPSDKLDLSLGYSARKDDFDDSEFGLIYDKIHELDGELSFTPRADVTMYVFGSRSERESFQRARQSGATVSKNPLDNWELTLSEDSDTWGGGLTSHFAKRWTVDLSGSWSRSNGNTEFFSPPGGTPDTAKGYDEYDDSEFWNLKARLSYRIDEHASLGVWYQREKYTADRFARDGLVTYMPSTLLLNANDGDYAAHLFAFSLKFRM